MYAFEELYERLVPLRKVLKYMLAFFFVMTQI